ncbi:MAG: murA, partial [Cyanobacteria bacterium RYN_339]|nr:murA [Cyanobacteria bacterium RYN_339]
MERLFVEGGKPLKGTVRVSGAKNSALALIAGTLLGDGVTTLTNVPNLLDVRIITEVLGHLGADATLTDDGSLIVDASGVNNHQAPYDLVTKMRA